jgi:hypothetical protein
MRSIGSSLFNQEEIMKWFNLVGVGFLVTASAFGSVRLSPAYYCVNDLKQTDNYTLFFPTNLTVYIGMLQMGKKFGHSCEDRTKHHTRDGGVLEQRHLWGRSLDTGTDFHVELSKESCEIVAVTATDSARNGVLGIKLPVDVIVFEKQIRVEADSQGRITKGYLITPKAPLEITDAMARLEKRVDQLDSATWRVAPLTCKKVNPWTTAPAEGL